VKITRRYGWHGLRIAPVRYRDTSRIVEVFTAEHGRSPVRARANRSKSALKGVLRPFQRLLVSWSESSRHAPGDGGNDGLMTNLAPERLMSGFY